MNDLKKYIINRFALEKNICILSVAFWIINFSMSEVCINMFMKIYAAGTSKWFDSALKNELSRDPFILNRTELLMKMMIAVLVMIIFFLVIGIVLFRNVQLKNKLEQMAIYRIVGYDKKCLLDICMIESIFDMIIAFPVSIICAIVIWIVLSKNEMISFMMAMMDNSFWLDVSSFIMCAGFMVLITIIHTKIFMERSLKKGIRYMLGQGVE